MNALKATGLLVGIGNEDGKEYTVLSVLNGSLISMNESATRMLADDLLRTANRIWPIEEKDNELKNLDN